MAPTAAQSTQPTSMRDITPRSRSSTAQEDLRTIRRTAEVGYGRSKALVQSLARGYKNVADTYSQVRGAHFQELTEANVAAAQSMRQPSMIRYGPWVIICLVVDIMVSPLVTAAYATIIGGIAAAVALGITMAIAGRLILGRAAKNAKKQREELEGRVAQLKGDAQQIRTQYVKFSRWAGRTSKRFPQMTTRLTSIGGKIGRNATKIKPLGKALTWFSRLLKNPWFKQTAEAIPVVNIVPWWTIAAFAAYIAHNAEYRQAQELLAQYNKVKSGFIDVTDDLYGTQLAVVNNEIVAAQAETKRTMEDSEIETMDVLRNKQVANSASVA